MWALEKAHDQVNAFLIPLDDERRWWRYQRLFADLLRVHLQHERGERPRDLHPLRPLGTKSMASW